MGAERFWEVPAEKDDFLLQLNDSKVSRELLELGLSEHDVILQAMKALVRQLGTKLSMIGNEKRLLKKTNEKQMRRYRKQQMVAKGSVAKPVESVATSLVMNAMCISRAISEVVIERDI